MTGLKKIKEMISTGDVEQALGHLTKMLSDSANKRHADFLLIKIRGYQQSFNSGLIDYKDYEIMNGRVTKAAIDLIQAVENGNDIIFESDDNPKNLNIKIDSKGLSAFNGNIIIKGKNVAGRDVNFTKNEESDSYNITDIVSNYLKRLKKILLSFRF